MSDEQVDRRSLFLENQCMKKIIVALICGFLMVGCTSVTVAPLDAGYGVRHICIRENPRVEVDELVPVMQEGLRRHNISNQFIPSTVDKGAAKKHTDKPDRYFMTLTPAPDNCEFSLIYTARRSWDMGTYLSTADIEILQNNASIASANYHLRNKGGLSLFKWQGVETKIAPVISTLSDYHGY